MSELGRAARRVGEIIEAEPHGAAAKKALADRGYDVGVVDDREHRERRRDGDEIVIRVVTYKVGKSEGSRGGVPVHMSSCVDPVTGCEYVCGEVGVRPDDRHAEAAKGRLVQGMDECRRAEAAGRRGAEFIVEARRDIRGALRGLRRDGSDERMRGSLAKGLRNKSAAWRSLAFHRPEWDTPGNGDGFLRNAWEYGFRGALADRRIFSAGRAKEERPRAWRNEPESRMTM